MHIDLLILFAVSLPEAVENLFMMLLFGAQKDRLRLNKRNILCFSSSVILMLIASWFLRPLAPNVLVNSLYHVTAYTIIIFAIYRKDFWKLFLGITTIWAFVFSIENCFVPFVITYIAKGLQNFLNNDLIIISCSIVVRLVAGAVAYLLWKYNDAVDAGKIAKSSYVLFAILNFIVIVSQMFFSQKFVDQFNALSFADQIVYAAVLLLMVIGLDVLIFALMFRAIGLTAAHGFKRYLQLQAKMKNENEAFEKDVQGAFSDIHHLLKDHRGVHPDVDQAIDLLEEVLDTKNQENN